MLILKINAVHKSFRLDFETYFYNNQSCSLMKIAMVLLNMQNMMQNRCWKLKVSVFYSNIHHEWTLLMLAWCVWLRTILLLCPQVSFVRQAGRCQSAATQSPVSSGSLKVPRKITDEKKVWNEAGFLTASAVHRNSDATLCIVLSARMCRLENVFPALAASQWLKSWVF